MTFLLQPILTHLQRAEHRLRRLSPSLPFSRWLLMSLALGLSLALSVGAGPARAIGQGSFSSEGMKAPDVFLGVAGGSAFHFSGSRPEELGFSEGRLAACPDQPNCVSSQATDEVHQIKPLDYESSGFSAGQVMQALKQVIDDFDRAEVFRAEDGYLYAEFTSRLMGFVDDVEFLFDPEHAQIEVRSASRLGESDLGVNRKRIESIRTQLQALLSETGAAEG